LLGFLALCLECFLRFCPHDFGNIILQIQNLLAVDQTLVPNTVHRHCHLLAGISDRELREDKNFSKIKAMIEACELFLWEINDDILRLKLFHPELIEEGEKYADSGWVNQKWFKEG